MYIESDSIQRVYIENLRSDLKAIEVYRGLF